MTRPQNPIPPYQLTNKVAWVWVTSVPDGDSLWVALSPNRGERTYPVRLFGIDAPERDQAYGQQAQWELRKLVERHTEGLLMEVLDVDRYNRLVALLYFPSADRYRSINRIMVEQGHAYWFRAFGGPPGLGFAAGEEAARSRRLGLWKHPASMKPWDYRRAQRRTTTQQSRQSGWLWVLAVLGLVILSVFLWNVVGAATENILDAFDKFTEWLNEVGWPGEQ